MVSSCLGQQGYASPQDAVKAPREKLLYTVALVPTKDRPDYVVTIDVDPESETYSKVIHRTYLNYNGDEVHHFGWNSCSSCRHADKIRSHLIVPGFISNRIYALDVSTDPKAPKIDKVIEPEDLKELNLGKFHTSHCQPNGEILISSLGDQEGNGKGNYLVLDQDFKIKGKWTDQDTKLGYDFWYQPRHNVMLSSEFGIPAYYEKGFDPSKVGEAFGDTIYLWDYEKRKLIKQFDVSKDGVIPLEIRFLHNPEKEHAFVGAALSSNVIHIYKDSNGEWQKETVIEQEPTTVEGWALPYVPPLVTDILISMDDKYLYISNWLRGDINQYDITDPFKPKHVGRLWAGGVIAKSRGLKITGGLPEGQSQPEDAQIKGKVTRGGPQMLQLSLDGKRLYFTDSLLSSWDQQFYPDLPKKGSLMLLADVNTEKGGLTLNPDFVVDFGEEPLGPVQAHEIRFPGGDCSSDIFD